MNKSFERNRPGSPKKSSCTEQPSAGLSTVGRQILVGLLTRRQVAATLQTCVHGVARYTKRGLLPAVVINPRLVRYKPEDVERFIQSAMTGKKEKAQ